MSNYNDDLNKTLNKKIRHFLDGKYKDIFKKNNLTILDIKPIPVTEMEDNMPKQYQGIDLEIKCVDENSKPIMLTAEEKIRWIKDRFANDPFIDLEIHHDIRDLREGYMKEIRSDIMIFVLIKEKKLELLSDDSVYIYKTSGLKEWYQKLKPDGDLNSLDSYRGHPSPVTYTDRSNTKFQLWINTPTYLGETIRNISSYIRIPPDYEGWKSFKYF